MNAKDNQDTNKFSELGLYVGVDWASESHYYVARGEGSKTLSEGYFSNSAEGFESFFERIDSLREGKSVAVIFEATKGAILYGLQGGPSWLRLCPVNPVKTKKLNELDGSAKGKSDPRDASLLCDYLKLKASELLQAHVERDSLMLRLREAVSLETELVARVTKLKQRIGRVINGLCPQLNPLIGDLEKKVYRAYLLDHSPLKLSSEEAIRTLLHAHRIYNQAYVDGFVEAHLLLRPLGHDRDLQSEQLENLRSMVRILEVTVSELRYCEKRIDGLFNDLPQAHIYRSMPGVGPRIGPRLADLFGSEPEKTYQSKAQALAYFGQTPLTMQTGSKHNKVVKKRVNCHKQARHAIYLWARVTNLNERSDWQRAYLDKCKARGDGLPTRYRKLGKKLVSILYRCLVDNVPYDSEIYMKNLHQKA